MLLPVQLAAGAEQAKTSPKPAALSLEFTPEEKKYLADFYRKQHEGSKDNVGTKTPIHVVERLIKTFVEDDSDEVFVDDDNNYDTYDSIYDLITARQKNGEALPSYEDAEYEEINGVWINNPGAYCEAFNINARSGQCFIHYEPVAFFFILDEAKRYKSDYQKHNSGDCRIYTYSLGYANKGDMPVFRELLMKMGQLIAAQDMIEAEAASGTGN